MTRRSKARAHPEPAPELPDRDAHRAAYHQRMQELRAELDYLRSRPPDREDQTEENHTP